MKEILYACYHLNAKYELIYIDNPKSSTVPVLLTYDRIDKIITDNSISIVRLIFDNSIVELREIARK